ncbi:MAG TPA: SPASM domain-containing protein [Candidatus Angelobacter sp.]|nr:SPASM domain-containing protein [Candidatus Angelobacter sp.]
MTSDISTQQPLPLPELLSATHNNAQEETASAEDRAIKLHNSAIELFRQQRLMDAQRMIERALAESESSIRWNDFATIAVAQNDVAGAERGYRRAVELDPKNVRAASNLVVLLESIGKVSVACKYRHLIPAELRAVVDASCAALAGHSALDAECKRLLNYIRSLSSINPDSPRFFQKAQQRGMAHCEYFVHRAMPLLVAATADVREELLGRLEHAAASDYRCGALAAIYWMEQGEFSAALSLFRKALMKQPEELFVEGKLFECLRLHKGNDSEAAIVEANLIGRTCLRPWSHLELASTGNAYMCCPSWLPLSVGNIKQSSAAEIWNSDAANAIRESIKDGSFHYCSKTQCPQITGGLLPKKSAETETALAALEKKPGPSRPTLSYDASCNLACPQCRRDFITATKAEQAEMDALFIPWIADVVKHADRLFLNGSGDVFGSKHSRALLAHLKREQYPNLKFEIITNAQLFDERAYAELDLAGRIHALKISIDAARPETYKFVRRGGSFERLLENLAFLDGLRTAGRDQFRLELFFVVSTPNFREMPEFVHLAKRFHADMALFTLLRSIGSFTDEEVSEWSVFNPQHRLHADFLKVLEAPEMRDPIVAGSLSQFMGENGSPAMQAIQDY